MEHNPPPNIKEDHRVWIKIYHDQQEFSVSCKIYLPKTILEVPQVYIFPNHELFDILPRLKGKCRFETTEEKHPFMIIGEDTHISGGEMLHWGKGLEEGYLKIYPSRLVIRHLNTPSDKNIIWFRLTPSIHLSPTEVRTTHFDGSAEINHSKKRKFDLTDNFNLTFKNYYRWNKTDNNKTINFSELYAEAEFQEPVEESHIEKYLSLVDDFLLLVSLAEGRRITAPQITVYLSEEIVDIYRMNRSLPQVSQKHSFQQCLIDIGDLDLFLNDAWGKLRESSNYDLKKSALAINTNGTPHTMESHFLSLFSSIETLILIFRSQNDREHIISDINKWNKLKNRIKSFIKADNSVMLEKDDRRLLYNNLNGLNRIPLQEAFEEYLKKYSIQCDDLWNFFGENSAYPLIKIRNRLVHGHALNDYIGASFSVALDNLEFYAKRLLLASLGWNSEKSNVFQRDDLFIKKWKTARERINDWD